MSLKLENGAKLGHLVIRVDNRQGNGGPKKEVVAASKFGPELDVYYTSSFDRAIAEALVEQNSRNAGDFVTHLNEDQRLPHILIALMKGELKVNESSTAQLQADQFTWQMRFATICVLRDFSVPKEDGSGKIQYRGPALLVKSEMNGQFPIAYTIAVRTVHKPAGQVPFQVTTELIMPEAGVKCAQAMSAQFDVDKSTIEGPIMKETQLSKTSKSKRPPDDGRNYSMA